MFPSGPPADPSSESDSGISEDPAIESPVTTVTAAGTQLAPTTVYQLVYDISGLDGAKTGAGQENIISIELGEATLCFCRSGFDESGDIQRRQLASCSCRLSLKKFVSLKHQQMIHAENQLKSNFSVVPVSPPGGV